MHYKQALQIGSADGTVQCTYATIYADPQGTQPLFSLQRKNFEDRVLIGDLLKNQNPLYSKDGNSSWGASTGKGKDEGIVATYTGYGAEGLVGWDQTQAGKGLATGYVIFDFPLVETDEWHADRFVPVKLTHEAASYLKRTLTWAAAKEYYILIDRQAEVKDGDTNVITDKDGNVYKIIKEYYLRVPVEDRNWYNPEGDEEMAARYSFFKTWDISPKYRKLRDKILNAESIYYVKPAAFNWHAVDTSHMNDEGSPYRAFLDKAEAEAQAAKAELDKAKKLLLLAGGAALL